jgi:hypothetical protein
MTAETGFANVTPEMFEKGPLRIFGKTLTRYAATGVEDQRGKITYSYGSGASFTGILHERSVTRVRSKEGYIELAPAFVAVLGTVTLNVADKVEDPNTGRVYRVHSKIESRRGIYNFYDLYFWEET